MRTSRVIAVGAIVATSAMVLAGCSAPNRDPEIVGGSAITVAWNDPFFAFNVNTSANNAAANANIVHVTSDGFIDYDPTPELVENTEFGTVEEVSTDPLTIKYTVNDGVTWSDGTPFDGADLLLTWAATTTHREAGEVPEAEYDDEGNVTNQDAIDAAADAGVYWGTDPAPGLQLDLASQPPVLADDNKSFTVVYDKPYADWKTMFAPDTTAISAHGTVQLAYPGEYDEAQAAKDAFITAVNDNDTAFLGKVATAYRTGYDYTSMPEEPQKTLSNGPYTITDLVENQYVTLTAREDYTWGPLPHYETITIRFIPDPQAQVQALQNGEVQIVSGQPTTDLLQQLEATEGIEWESSLEGTYEHVDLQVANGGVFDPATYGGDEAKAQQIREAFLLTIPRQEIVEKLITPIAPDATTRDSLVFLPGADGYEESVADSGVSRYSGDDAAIEEAKGLLAQAGVANPSVRFMTASTNPRRQQELQLIKASAEKAGFTIVDASAEDWSTVLTTQTDAYDAALFGWQSEGLGVGEPSPNYITGGINNYYGWSDPELDQILKDVDVTIDPAEAQGKLVEAEKIIMENSWSVPIFQFPGVVAWSDEVANVKPGFLSPQYFWNAWEWAPVEAAE